MINDIKKLFKNIDFSLFYKANLFLTLFISFLFLLNNNGYSFGSFILLLLASISSSTILYLVFFILLFLVRATDKIVIYLSATIFVITNISLIIDFFIYKIFKFHINAMVINILTSPDAADSIQIGMMPVILFVLIVIFFIAYEVFIIKSLNKADIPTKEKLNKRLNKLMIMPLLLIILIEKFTYGYFSLESNNIIAKFKVIPLYQPLTFNRISAKYFNYKPRKLAQNRITTDALLNYPTSKIQITDNPNKFNIFIFISDAVRNTDINKETAPNIENFKKDSLVFNNHHSGGDATRFGVFSLFYALNSTYWFSFFNAQQSPVLIDTLIDLGYNFNIISSTSTSWPEFDKTVYTKINRYVKDDFTGSPWQKDEQLKKYFIDTLSSKIDKPLFSFVFMDAPHGYSFPQYANKFNASKTNINYLTISKDSKDVSPIYARYKNAIHFNDMMFGDMIKAIKEKGLYDDALIIYSSDHGEEFYEYGFFGHNTSFSNAQTNSPFIIKLPNNLKNKVELPENFSNLLTSHSDIVPTILKLIGVKNKSSDYSNGYNLFDKNFHRDYVFCANWNNNAIITNKYTYVFSNLPNKMFKNEIRDSKTYEEIPDAKQIKSKLLLDAINNNKRFLK